MARGGFVRSDVIGEKVLQGRRLLGNMDIMIHIFVVFERAYSENN